MQTPAIQNIGHFLVGYNNAESRIQLELSAGSLLCLAEADFYVSFHFLSSTYITSFFNLYLAALGLRSRVQAFSS